MKILNDEDFENEYEKYVFSFCKEHEESRYFKSFDGRKMHYLAYVNPNAKAIIVILHGFTECAKKFDEMAYYFYNDGYSVYSLDLRGHGFSFKNDAPIYAVDSNGFDEYSKDLKAFIDEIVSKQNLPIYCYTHSLGGNAALLSIIEDNAPIDKIVLSSPMICGDMGMPVKVAKVISKLIVSLGCGLAPVPKKCRFNPYEINNDATSVSRATHAMGYKIRHKECQTCGPTFNWVCHSLIACDKLTEEGNIKKINTSMLLIKPEVDAQLLESYQDKFIEICEKNGKDITVVKTENTHHEIYQSRCEDLEKYLTLILDFFKK